jgi:LuxR family maltose regulon positive regulatory protein
VTGTRTESAGPRAPLQFAPPAVRAGQIVRSRLLRGGSPSRSTPVMIVQAPPGYGKSTFAAQWCRADDRPVAWLSLRDSDNDIPRLISRLTEALDGLDPVDADLLHDLHRPEPKIESVLLPRFLDDMALRVPTLLCLDNAHVIHDPAAATVMAGLVNAVPDGSQLVLVSRRQPQLGLARIRAAGDLHEVGATDLALNEIETRQLFSSAGIDLSGEEAFELCAVTEGWPVALALRAAARSKTGPASHTPPLPLQRDVADYFREEVLDREGDGVREFLLATSVVEKMSAPLCDALTGRDDSAALLRRLVSANLFVVAIDDDQQWFRYHPLVRSLLQAELHRAGNRDTADLFNRAAAWHEVHGDPVEAFEYARRGQDFQRAGRVLLLHWDQYVDSGQGLSLLRLLEQCDEADVESDPQLALAASWISAHVGDVERANRYLAVAERGDLDGPSADSTTSLHAAMLALRATLGAGGAASMLEDGLSFVASELPAHSRHLSSGYLAIGVAHLLLGHAGRAIEAFNETLVLTEGKRDPRTIHARAYCLGLLALAHADLGDWAHADRHARTAEELLVGHDLALHRLPMLVARATVDAEAGDSAAAAARITEAGETMPTARAFPSMQAELSLRCAQVAHRRGDNESASALAVDAQMACLRLEDPGSVPDRLNTLRERITGADPLVAALSPAQRRVLKQLASHRTLQEIADQLYVSRATVKSHVSAIYNRLGVSTRAEAVAALGDRNLGLRVDGPALPDLPAGRDMRLEPNSAVGTPQPASTASLFDGSAHRHR